MLLSYERPMKGLGISTPVYLAWVHACGRALSPDSHCDCGVGRSPAGRSWTMYNSRPTPVNSRAGPADVRLAGGVRLIYGVWHRGGGRPDRRTADGVNGSLAAFTAELWSVGQSAS